MASGFGDTCWDESHETSDSSSGSEEEVQYCQCKSTCQRANRCPCKGKGQYCTHRCKCKSTSGPCKNRAVESDEGTSKVQEALRTNREEVKALVQSLDNAQQEQLLVELLQDRGGVELARCLLQRSTNGDEPQPPQGALPWCKCGKCRHMDNPVEHLCCKMRPCITTTDAFHDTCLNRNVLSVCILDRSDFYGDVVDFSPASFRKAAYRQYIMFSHGYLGRGNRKVAPSCVVWKIRDNYPAPDNVYLGFREH